MLYLLNAFTVNILWTVWSFVSTANKLWIQLTQTFEQNEWIQLSIFLLNNSFCCLLYLWLLIFEIGRHTMWHWTIKYCIRMKICRRTMNLSLKRLFCVFIHTSRWSIWHIGKFFLHIIERICYFHHNFVCCQNCQRSLAFFSPHFFPLSA